MKNILIILPYFPYPLNSGGNIAVFEMINDLRFKLHITLIVPESTIENKNELFQKWENVEIITYKNDSIFIKLFIKLIKFCLHVYLSFLSILLTKKNYTNKFITNSLFPFFNKNIILKTNQVIEANNFDFIQIEFYELLPIIKYLNHNSNTIFIHHEIRYVRFSRTMQENFFNEIILNLIKAQEIEFLKQYSKIVTVSKNDKDILSKEIISDKIIASPLTISLTPVKNIDEFKFNNTLTYLGGSAHYPNKDAIGWFLDNCWSVLQNNTTLKLNIIGQWTKSEQLYFSKKFKNIQFLGFVNNLELALKNSIMIVPIRIGSGMRMKIIEAANYKIPFITTSVGVEGLCFENNKHCIIADTAETFIEAISELINSDDKQRYLINNASELIKSEYNSNTLFKKRFDIYS